ncbi:aldo/keto reductase [Georgenia halophila]
MPTPQLVLGTMYFGTRLDDAESFALLDRFVEAGGRWLDTADCYCFWEAESGHGGQSEAVIGRWLAANPSMRSEVRISTKIGAEPQFPGGFPEHVGGLSAQAIRDAFLGSRDRLGVDSVDLLWAHIEDRSARLEETVEAMTDLVTAGATQATGFSNHPTWIVERAQHLARGLGRPAFTALQHSYSYLQPRPYAPIDGQDHRFGMLTDEHRDYARSNGLDVWAYSPLLQGRYDRDDRDFTSAYEHIGNERRLAALRQVADELGVSPGQVVLAWLVGSTPSITPMLGGSTVEQLDAALVGVQLTLAQEQRGLLDAAS